jgi:hypothetical protein
LHNLALFRVKNANFFAEFFGENIFKIITSVPGWADHVICRGTQGYGMQRVSQGWQTFLLTTYQNRGKYTKWP